MRDERGSALITVILVVLVLTMVGIASLFFMTTEDRISGVDRNEKSALYGAESGMRQAEKVAMQDFSLYGTATAGTLLAKGGATVALPGGGYPAIPLVYDPPAVASPGYPVATMTFLNQPVQGFPGLTYSLYIRNNSDDPSHSAVVDQDMLVNLVAIARLQAGANTMQKIVEEQYMLGSPASGESLQKQLNFGGTGTAVVGR